MFSSRTNGLRMALGAKGADVLRQIMSRGFLITASGVLLGFGAAAALTGLLGRLLFEVRSLDALTFAGAAGVLAVVALPACWLPARRASRIDPAICLRQD